MHRRGVIYIGIGATLALIIISGLVDSRPVVQAARAPQGEQTTVVPPPDPGAR